jgi:hypothetical protein
LQEDRERENIFLKQKKTEELLKLYKLHLITTKNDKDLITTTKKLRFKQYIEKNKNHGRDTTLILTTEFLFFSFILF